MLESKEIRNHTPQTGVSDALKHEKKLLRAVSCTELFFLNSCKISRKLPITKSDYSNVASATLIKSLSVVDIFHQILQELRKLSLKEHLRRAASAAFLQRKIKGFDLKSSF